MVQSHQEAAEAKLLLELRPNFALGGVHDVRPAAEQANLGGLLTPAQLLDVQDTLRGSRSFHRAIDLLKDRLPVLWERVRVLPDCRDVEDDVGGCIGPRGEVLDGASPTLAHLRREVRRAHEHLTGRLNDLLYSPRGRVVLQDPIITLRNGRYVVPVKADFRGELKGIVHDLSASGATVFMEPLETVELGNTWRQLQIEEERETERVLRRLSALVGDYASEIEQTVTVLAHADVTLAKAKYGLHIRGVAPNLPPPTASRTQPAHLPQGNGQLLRLTEARHPLLTGRVVPISLELGDDQRALVITGPNTGGKTVALKTVGLLVLMAQAGIPIPAAEGTVLPLYREVFADIGDEQSIEQSLSTFSSHMRAIIDILEQAGDDCLVLLDELGAGTDPTEGSALARAILERLLQRGVPTIATTHHSDLKAFAHNTPGIRNASVEFDEETLAPTFRLIIGLPGRSNAIAIAERLGLRAELADAARRLLHPQDLHVATLLADLQRERDAATRERHQVEEELEQATATRVRLDALQEQIEAEKEEMAEEAGRELTIEVEALKVDLRRATQEIQRALREQQREHLLAAASALQESEEKLASPRWRPARRRKAPQDAPPLRLSPGARVQLRGLGQTAEIVAAPSPEGEVEVQMGAFRAKVKVDQLEAVDKRALTSADWRSPSQWAFSVGPTTPVESELHLRGLRVEEAIVRLEEYLDQAFRAGLPWVRVVHGRGTGAMRRAVRETLSGHPLVPSFESPPQREGGEGVTVAHLAQ